MRMKSHNNQNNQPTMGIQPTKTYVLSERLSISLGKNIDNYIGFSIWSSRTGEYFYDSFNTGSFGYADRKKLKGLADFINNYLENN